jgi:acetoin utilization deacetylase AcuC-like enzyme
LFNNIAILAHWLIKNYNLKKIAILDWDVHHGNGTQHAFYSSNSVHYCSLHQYPFFPGTGRADETGEGEGKGYTMNFPLPAGSGDKEYLESIKSWASEMELFLP